MKYRYIGKVRISLLNLYSWNVLIYRLITLREVVFVRGRKIFVVRKERKDSGYRTMYFELTF